MEEQQRQIQELMAQIKNQATQINKVSAQLELGKCGSQTVAATGN